MLETGVCPLSGQVPTSFLKINAKNFNNLFICSANQLYQFVHQTCLLSKVEYQNLFAFDCLLVLSASSLYTTFHSGSLWLSLQLTLALYQAQFDSLWLLRAHSDSISSSICLSFWPTPAHSGPLSCSLRRSLVHRDFAQLATLSLRSPVYQALV